MLDVPSPVAGGPRPDLVRLTNEGLDREITTLAAEIYAATCRWLELIAEFDRRRGYEEWGFWSCSAWLAWRCGVAQRAARDHVRVARALRELPRIRSAFGRGELSYSKVRALTRVAEAGDEEELLELARHATAAQLDRVVRAYRGALDSGAALEAHRERFLSWSWDDDGSLLLEGRLPAEEGALLLRALEAGRDGLRDDDAEGRGEAADQGGGETGQGGSAEPRRVGDEPQRDEGLDSADRRRASNADALVAIGESFLASGASSRPGGERYQVHLHVDAEALAVAGEGRSSIEDGPGLAPETARRLACDASLIPIVHDADGRTRSGRRARTVPPSTRRALRARDRGCRFPGCRNRRFVDAHHVRHWADGGETTVENLVQLCRRHHRLLHEGGFSVERRGGERFLFRRPDGTSIHDVPRLAEAVPRSLRAGNRRAGVRVGPESCLPLSAEERMDLDLIVLGLLAVRGRANRARAPG